MLRLFFGLRQRTRIRAAALGLASGLRPSVFVWFKKERAFARRALRLPRAMPYGWVPDLTSLFGIILNQLK